MTQQYWERLISNPSPLSLSIIPIIFPNFFQKNKSCLNRDYQVVTTFVVNFLSSCLIVLGPCNFCSFLSIIKSQRWIHEGQTGHKRMSWGRRLGCLSSSESTAKSYKTQSEFEGLRNLDSNGFQWFNFFGLKIHSQILNFFN